MTIIERSYTLDPIDRNWDATLWRYCSFWFSLRFDGCLILPGQSPQPLTASSKSSSTRRYPERSFRALEYLRVGDALTRAQQACRSGHGLEGRYAHIILCERIP
jgi:hypothetical protein